ncbi:hypothetical protein Plhal304r1_c008g0030521 [Plasmopara halstedii]
MREILLCLVDKFRYGLNRRMDCKNGGDLIWKAYVVTKQRELLEVEKVLGFVEHSNYLLPS